MAEPNAQKGNAEEVQLQIGSGAAARSAGAYGGSEVGNIVGGMVGPPVIGGIVGGLVGEVVGADAVGKYGLDDKAKKVSRNMEKVIGKRNTDKVAEITMTALGYSVTETCICCPCMPASQIMFFVILAFFCFNCYRLGYVLDLPRTVQNASLLAGTNSSQPLLRAQDWELSNYLLVGSAVWIAFLPFYLFTLFGNCWRQCCCCLCDPVVCCATMTDFLKRCLCECGSFSFLQFIWYMMCAFQIVWTLYGVYYLIHEVTKRSVYWNEEDQLVYFYGFLIAAIVLDVFIAGSEIIHKLYHDQLIRKQKNIEREQKAIENTIET